jgi:hypothetical protein
MEPLEVLLFIGGLILFIFLLCLYFVIRFFWYTNFNDDPAIYRADIDDCVIDVTHYPRNDEDELR